MLTEKLVSDGGFTVSLDGKAVPTTGFVCGGFGTDFQAPLAEFGDVHLLRYVRENAEALSHGSFFGGWVDEGIVYLDVSRVFDDLEFAKRQGKEKGQKALWDLVESKNIVL